MTKHLPGDEAPPNVVSANLPMCQICGVRRSSVQWARRWLRRRRVFACGHCRKRGGYR